MYSDWPQMLGQAQAKSIYTLVPKQDDLTFS